ncbi:MAG: lipoyl protein ligase domain-containing protein [Thermoplasmatota archaeon]
MESWRLLDTPPASAAENMALDECILRVRARGRAPNTLRFMQIRPHAVLVGYHQSVELEIREEYCRRRGIEINRRLTGGGSLYFDESQLGWEIFASRDTPGVPRRVEDMYRKMCEGTILGLRRLGVEARFRPKNDIEVRGRKISGTGGTFEGGAFLFQGTLLIDFDAGTMLRALRIPIEKLKDKEVRAVKRRVTWLSEELGRAPPLSAVKRALARGFSEALRVDLIPGALTPHEKRLLKKALPRFRSPRWIYGVRRPPGSRRVLRAARKCAGGLIRASIVADPLARRIQYALITGDFFAFPRDAIMNLEARLKDSPLDRRCVARAVERFFRDERPVVPFAGPKDFIRVIDEALAKRSWVRFGIAPEEVNDVIPVVKRLEDMRSCDHLLLPYCAKPLDCRYRKVDGCAECGRCSIGEMYSMAREIGLRPISINSYHHLETVLRRLRRQGSRGFIGSCCEAFYIKHREDFERLGVPGVLVDIDSRTCYDIYKDAEAHAGRFDRQTRLKTELFKRVARRFSNRPNRSRRKGKESP